MLQFGELLVGEKTPGVVGNPESTPPQAAHTAW